MNFGKHNQNAPTFNIVTNADVTYLTSPVFDKVNWLNHGISTRLGGVSEGFCASMNLAYNGFDDEAKVSRNYEILAQAAGFDVNRIVRPKQVHGTNIVKIAESHVFKSYKDPIADYQETDGLITNLPGVTLCSYSADCAIIQICDPVNKAIGQCHSGWRGTKDRISAKLITMMTENYGSNPANLLVSVSPSICQECFEVEWDMIKEARIGFRPEEYDKIYYKKNEVKYQFNLWEANRIVLMDAGVRDSNIFLPNLCTKCNPETMFSHRNSGLKRGTLMSFMCII